MASLKCSLPDRFLDPKVEVIYVCPVELTDDVYQYYSKLLAMKANAESDDDLIENRYKIIVPDSIHRFPVSIKSTLLF